MRSSTGLRIELLLACLTLQSLSGCCVSGVTYKFVLFWPQSGVASKAQAQYEGIFRNWLNQLCTNQGATVPSDVSVAFEEFLVPVNPSFSQLQSYANRLNGSSSDILFAGTTSANSEARLQLASLVAPRPLHWVDPPKLSDLSDSLYRIIRIVQRIDLSTFGAVTRVDSLVIVVGPPYRLSDVQSLVRMFNGGVRCFAMDLSILSNILYDVLNTKVTTLFVLADRSSTRAFLENGLDSVLWSPDYRWILYDSGLVGFVKTNMMPANSRNMTSIEFLPYDITEAQYLNTQEDVVLYDLLSLWTIYLANLTCGLSVSNLRIQGLTGLFNVTGSRSYIRHNWQMSIYGNLLTESILVGNFSTSGDFSMMEPQARSNDRNQLLQNYRKLNLSVFVIPGSRYIRYKDGMENQTDLPLRQRLEGMSFDLCMDVMAGLGLTNFTVFIQEDFVYGAINSNGEWNGIIASLINGVADIACVDMMPNSARSEVIDFTSSYLTTNMSILYKKNRTDATKEMFQFMFALNINTWFYLLGAVLIVAIVLAILHRISANDQLFDLRYSMFFSFASLMQGIVGNPPNRPSGRIVVSAYWLFVLILLVSYVSNYAAMRTLARIEVEITTVVSLLSQTSYTYGTLSNSSLSAALKDSTFSEFRQVYAAMRRFPNGLFTDQKVAEDAIKAGTYAAILDTPTSVYLQQLICDSVITGYFQDSATVFGLPKRSDLVSLIDEELIKLQENGRVNELYNKYFIIPQRSRPACIAHPLSGVIPVESASLTPRSGALTLHNTLGLLVINVIGCCLTLIVAAFERTWNSMMRRRAQNVEKSKTLKLRRHNGINELFGRDSRA